MKEYFEGKLHITKEGYGFVVLEDENLNKSLGDIFIPKRCIKDALHNDIVLVKVFRKKYGKSLEGRIVKILKRGTLYVYGTIKKKHKKQYILVSESLEFYLEPAKKNKQYINCKVKARIIDYSNKIVRVVKNYGIGNSIDTAEKMIYDEYDLSETFNRKVRRQIKLLSEKIPEKEYTKRKKLLKEKIITIDPIDAKDFDDAISLKESEKSYILQVHISDVSYYVEKDTPLDKEAYKRGTSIYLPGKVIPMLPEKLSNDICSLKENKERLTITVELHIDKKSFEVKKTLFFTSIIKVSKRFNYDEVDEILNSNENISIYSPLLKKMNFLAQKLRQLRFKKGSLDLDLPEIILILDENNKVIDYKIEYSTLSHQLIEEFMVLANKAVAEYLTEKKAPLMYRIHEKPFEEKLYEFFRLLSFSGINVKTKGKIKISDLQDVITRTKAHPDNKIIIYNLLRSLKQAKYSAVNYSHFGLGFDKYTHFTSPIRRYPDLFVQRVLKKFIEKPDTNKDELKEFSVDLEKKAQHCSIKEREAEECEREMKKIKLLEYLSDKINKVYTAQVSGIINSGIFVELKMGVEAFLPFSQLKGYIFDEKAKVLISKDKRKTIKLGSKIKVYIKSIDIENRKLYVDEVSRLSLYS